MARPVRGLPDSFSLDLPEERPVQIGDFLDEEPPPVIQRARKPKVQPPQKAVEASFRPELVRRSDERVGEVPPARPLSRSNQQPSVTRCQLNLAPKSKTMLEDLVKHVRTFSPQNDARTNEVFQGIMTLLHGAKDELELAELPRRGAWGSVTAKNFPSALSEAFEKAILRAARKRGESL